MSEDAQVVTLIASVGVLVSQGVLAVLAASHFLGTPELGRVWYHLWRHALMLGFLAALLATLGSLYYSEIVGLPVCKLCWLQRIAIYPLALILGIAWWRDDREIWRYALPLSAVGAVVSLWHYLLQKTGSAALACGSDAVADCSKQFFNEFGYITFPMMGLTTLAFTAFFSYLARVPK